MPSPTSSSTLQQGLALYNSLEPLLYPSLNPALVLGQDISHYCPSLMYGELSGETLVEALRLIEEELGGLPPQGEGSLIDIGSGIGKQVFVAACLYGWKKCVGVEIYEKRARMAGEALERWRTEVVGGKELGGGGGEGVFQSVRVEGALVLQVGENETSSSISGGGAVAPAASASCTNHALLPPTLAVDFICGDVVDLGVEGFSVLLLVSAAFTDSLMETIAIVLDEQPVGTWAVCITKGLPSIKWEVVYKSEREEPWGRAWLIIQKKIVA